MTNVERWPLIRVKSVDRRMIGTKIPDCCRNLSFVIILMVVVSHALIMTFLPIQTSPTVDPQD